MPPKDFWIVHNGRVILSVSLKVLALFRCEAIDLVGKDIFELIPNPEMRGLARLRMEHIVNRGNLREQELPLRRPDGSEFWAKVQTERISPDMLISYLEYIGDHNPNFRGT